MRQGTGAKTGVAVAALLLSAWVAIFGLASASADASVSGRALAQTTQSLGMDPSKLFAPPGFTMRASNGYSMFVFGSAAYKGRPASLAIFVTGKSGGVIYSTPATVTETSIQANLGALGEIAVTFHSSGQARTERSSCGGKPVSFDSGYYEGTIDFHGEEGYTAVEATRAAGDLGFLLDIVCPGISGVTVGGAESSFFPGAELDVNWPGSRHLPHLKVVKNRPGARAHFEAGISEEHEGIAVARFIGAIAPAGTFEYDPLVKTATVHPPAPFSGTAQFHRNAKPANRWTGDLKVDLPGKADVKLTGSNTRAKLAHAHWDWHSGSGDGRNDAGSR